MDLTLLVMLASLPVLIAASAFFSGSETSLFSLTKHQRLMIERRGGASAVAVATLLAETRGLLITLLLGNMTVNVLFFAISAAAAIRVGEKAWSTGWLLTALAILPLIVIVLLGEVAPKLVAARARMTWARYASVPLLAVHRLITPIRVVAQHGVITPLARLVAPAGGVDALSADELESLLRLSEHHGVLDSEEERLLQQVLELGQLRVEDLMIPRVDVKSFDLASSAEELMDLIRETGLRHIPVTDGSLDQVVGLLYSRQVLVARPETAEDVRKLIRQVRFVPAVAAVDRLLVELRKSGTTFAMVVDEYGGTAGLITLEDVAEHMVGDIAGEYEDSGAPLVQMIGLGRWRIGGDLSVHDWPDIFGHDMLLGSDDDGVEVSTLGGLVMAMLGRLPRVGDRLDVGNVRLTVASMKRRRVETLLLEMTDAPALPVEDEGESS
ncbi:hemolysin family protein [Mucisphaera sp.]|uniref:hemolysin family protein n=1 Tax=Mucisphaera sp. TaxID=2913024 RepID=UPI003D102868